MESLSCLELSAQALFLRNRARIPMRHALFAADGSDCVAGGAERLYCDRSAAARGDLKPGVSRGDLQAWRARPMRRSLLGTLLSMRTAQVKRGYDQYNSADFIAPDGSFVGRYDKMHLVPFGEYVPYKKLFFFAGSLLQDVGLFDPGKHRTVFTTGGHTYGTFICYESVFARRDAPVCADGRGCAGEYLRRWMVWRHQRGVGAPEYGAHAGHREPSLGAARHQYRSDGGDRSLWPGRNFRAAAHPHKPSRGLQL